MLPFCANALATNFTIKVLITPHSPPKKIPLWNILPWTLLMPSSQIMSIPMESWVYIFWRRVFSSYYLEYAECCQKNTRWHNSADKLIKASPPPSQPKKSWPKKPFNQNYVRRCTMYGWVWYQKFTVKLWD